MSLIKSLTEKQKTASSQSEKKLHFYSFLFHQHIEFYNISRIGMLQNHKKARNVRNFNVYVSVKNMYTFIDVKSTNLFIT